MERLIPILILAATLIVAQAETYSKNVIGYVLKDFTDGFQLVVNPLNFKDNTIKTIFGEHISNTLTIYKFDGDAFSVNSFDTDFDEWDDPTQELLPGEGFFLHIPKAPEATNTLPSYVGTMMFIGEVPVGELSSHLYNGFSLVGSQVPQAGLLDEDLGFPTKESSTIYQLKDGKYTISSYDKDFEEWDDGQAPYINLAESFWVAQNYTSQWVRNFRLEDLVPDGSNGASLPPRGGTITPMGGGGGDDDDDIREGEGILSIETKMSADGMAFRLSATELVMDVPYYLEFTNGSREWVVIHINGFPFYMMNKSLDFENIVSSFWFAVRRAVNPAFFRLRKYEPEGDEG